MHHSEEGFSLFIISLSANVSFVFLVGLNQGLAQGFLLMKEMGWGVDMTGRRACGERPSAVAAG